MKRKTYMETGRCRDILREFRKWAAKRGRKYVNIPGVSAAELLSAAATAEAVVRALERVDALAAKFSEREEGGGGEN